MNKKLSILISLASISIAISGCAISQDEMTKKPYVAIVTDMSELGCTSLHTALEAASASTTYGVVSIDRLYTEESVECSTYDKDDTHCTKKSFNNLNILNGQDDNETKGEGSCVLGADSNFLSLLI